MFKNSAPPVPAMQAPALTPPPSPPPSPPQDSAAASRQQLKRSSSSEGVRKHKHKHHHKNVEDDDAVVVERIVLEPDEIAEEEANFKKPSPRQQPQPQRASSPACSQPSLSLSLSRRPRPSVSSTQPSNVIQTSQATSPRLKKNTSHGDLHSSSVSQSSTSIPLPIQQPPTPSGQDLFFISKPSKTLVCPLHGGLFIVRTPSTIPVSLKL